MSLPSQHSTIYEALIACQADGVPAALAIIVEAVGSTPQKTGAKLLVRADGVTVGTVGGGNLEVQVIQAAHEVIQSGTPCLLNLELTQTTGYLCGGRLRIYLEPVTSPPLLIIIGAGHVGLALAALAAYAGFRVTLADDRNIALPSGLAQANLVKIEDYGHPFDTMTVSEYSFIVIATRGHHHDLEALAAALRTPASFVGLLGSSQKKAAMAQALMDLGFAHDSLARVHTPVGLSLGAVSPEEIAVSIVAQLITYRRNHAPNDFGPPVGRRLVDPDGSAESLIAPGK
jgi:xanthine dehydrogenase accessory factor